MLICISTCSIRRWADGWNEQNSEIHIPHSNHILSLRSLFDFSYLLPCVCWLNDKPFTYVASVIWKEKQQQRHNVEGKTKPVTAEKERERERIKYTRSLYRQLPFFFSSFVCRFCNVRPECVSSVAWMCVCVYIESSSFYIFFLFLNSLVH